MKPASALGWLSIPLSAALASSIAEPPDEPQPTAASRPRTDVRTIVMHHPLRSAGAEHTRDGE